MLQACHMAEKGQVKVRSCLHVCHCKLQLVCFNIQHYHHNPICLLTSHVVPMFRPRHARILPPSLLPILPPSLVYHVTSSAYQGTMICMFRVKGHPLLCELLVFGLAIQWFISTNKYVHKYSIVSLARVHANAICLYRIMRCTTSVRPCHLVGTTFHSTIRNQQSMVRARPSACLQVWIAFYPLVKLIIYE